MFDVSVLQVAAEAIAAEVTHFSLHTAGDVADSGDEAVSVARVPAVWEVADGTLSAFPSFTGDPDLVVTRVGYWTAGGDFAGGQFLPDGSALSGTGHVELAVAESGFSA